MFKKSCFTAEFLNGVLHHATRFLKVAYAEETPNSKDDDTSTTSTAAAPKSQINYEELISAARKEEKDKLYPRITKLEEEKKTLISTNNANLITIGELKSEVETLKTAKGDSKEVITLQKKVKDLEEENKTLKDSAPNAETIRSEIAKEYEVKLYLEKQKSDNKDKILATIVDEVKGTTTEEIDASVAAAIKKTEDTKKLLGITDEPAPHKTKEKKPSPANPGNALDMTAFDPEYLRSLDPSSQEYKDWRKKQGLK